VSEDSNSSASWREQALQNFDGGRLPCTVRTQKSEAFAGFDLQADAADGFDFSVIGLA
jgi:hypothetical protein